MSDIQKPMLHKKIEIWRYNNELGINVKYVLRFILFKEIINISKSFSEINIRLLEQQNNLPFLGIVIKVKSIG